MGDEYHRCVYAHAALHLAAHLAVVDLRHDEPLALPGQFPHPLLREGPGGDQPEKPGFDPLGLRLPHSVGSDAGGDAVGQHYHVGVVHVPFPPVQDVGGIFLNLGNEPFDQCLLRCGAHVRVASLVVGQAGHGDVVSLAQLRHGRYQFAFFYMVGGELPGREGRAFPLPDLDLFLRRNDQLLDHVPHFGVGHHQHGQAVALREVERPYGQIEAFLHRPGAEGDDLIGTMRTPAGLHHVPLADHRRQAGGGAAPLHVDDHAGGLGHDAQADVLHHQAEARARGGRHGFEPAPRSSQHRGDGAQFVLHLHVVAADVWQPRRHALGGFRAGGDGIAAEETAARSQRAFGASHVAHHKMCACQYCLVQRTDLRLHQGEGG